MDVVLNEVAFEHARRLIRLGRYVADERDDWSEHRPSVEEENQYLVDHDLEDYGKWYLGINREARHDIKAKFELPYGDFENVHRCGVLLAESRAAEYGRRDIEAAAHELHEMIDERRRGRRAHP